MAIVAGKVVISAGNIETLNFDFTPALKDGQTLSPNATAELKRIDGDDLLCLVAPTVPTRPDADDFDDQQAYETALNEYTADINTYVDYAFTAIDRDESKDTRENYPPEEEGVPAAVSDDGKRVSIEARALTKRGAERVNRAVETNPPQTPLPDEREDGELDSIWEVICRVKVSPGGYADSASMIVIGNG